MDTVMTLEAYGANAEAALDAAEDEITRLDALWSISSEDGEIAQLNANKQITASEDTLTLLSRAKEISAATDGLFSTTIAPLMEAGDLRAAITGCRMKRSSLVSLHMWTTRRSRSAETTSRSRQMLRWISAALPRDSHRRG